MATDSGTYQPEAIARRRAIAEELAKNANKRPITHWMQGVQGLAENAYSGYLEGQNRRDEKEGASKIADMLLGLTGGAGQPAPGGPLANAPMPAGPQGANVASKIYSPDEPSPLDPPSGKDRDLAIRTMNAEAGNQPPIGQQAVANVIRNRAVAGNYGGDTPSGVVTAPNQFEPWNTAGGRDKMAALDPKSARYQQLGGALDKAYTGDDPTNGAVNFFAPKAQAALGRPVPAWGAQGGQDIGDHRFFGGKPVDPAANTALAFNGQPNQATDAPMPGGVPSPAAMPPAANAGTTAFQPEAAPQQVAQALQQPAPTGQPPAQNQLAAKVAEMLRDPNPYVRKMGQQYGQQLLQQQFAAPSYEFKTAGDNLYRTSSQTGKAEPIAGARKWGVIGKDQYGNEQYGYPPADGGTNVNPQQAAPQSSPIPPTADGATPAGMPPAPPGYDPKTWRKEWTEAEAKKQFAAPDKAKQEQTVGNIITQDIDRALKGIDASALPATGAMGSALAKVPGTMAHDVSKLLDTVKANAGFQELAKMRAASPTGAALGAISDRETTLLQSTIGNLEQSQSAAQLKDNLKRVKNTYMDIIHGPGKGPEREKLSYSDKDGAAKSSGAPSEGQTATNPKTGAKVVFKAGQWVPQ